MSLTTDNLPVHSWLEMCLKLEAGFLPSDMTVKEAMVLARASFAERNKLDPIDIEVALESGSKLIKIQGFTFIDNEEHYTGADRYIFNSLKECQPT